MEYVLQTHGLSKKYKRNFAVSSVDMNICKGDIYGFVGENGSGKTTVIRLITGLISPYSGSFELFGEKNTSKNILKARKRTGAIVEAPSIYRNMSAYENLKMQSIILGKDADERILEVLETVGLGALYTDKKKAGNFSLGMRQRLGIAMALLGDPEFLILDEPMNGLDPSGIVGIRELILKLNREKGITFLISSHILTELSLVATKYGIISKGRLIKEITSQQLHLECTGKTVITVDRPDGLRPLFDKSLDAVTVEYTPQGMQILGQTDLNAVLGAIIKAGIKILSVNCRETTFEDYYLSLIGGVI